MPGDGSYPYDVSIIVPVYNAAEHLTRCVASLDAQTMPQERFEVVLVNDGSTDDSLELAKACAAKRSNYVVIDQVNRGVSAARNAGIDASHGRYLMFLDPDDELSSPSAEALVQTFDQLGDSVDLVTYQLTYHDAFTGKERQHKRQEWLTKTGAYDLQEYPQLAQTTVNVCIHNLGESTPRFDETIRLGEDQRFNTEILSRKATIGYCHEAEYTYWRYEGTAATRHLTEETFEGLAANYERYVELAKEHEAFARYAYALVIYETSWRIRQDELLPHKVNKATRHAARLRMDALLRHVPRENWLESSYLSDTLRVYQMHRYNKLGMVNEINYAEDGTYFLHEDGSELRLDLPRAVITWAERIADSILVKGYLYGPSFLLEAKPELTVVMKDERRIVELEPSPHNDEKTHMRITKAWQFELTLSASCRRPYDCELLLAFNERCVPMVDLRFDLERSNGRMINAHMREFGELRLTLVDNRLHVGAIKDLPSWMMPAVMPLLRLHDKRRKGDYDYRQVNELRQRLTNEVKNAQLRRVWLYDDGKTGQVSLTQMLNDIQLSDGATRLYVADDAKVAAAVQLLGAVTVDRGSFDHVLWFLRAEKVFSATDDLEELFPCDKAVFERVRDFTREGQQYVLVSEGLDRLDSTAFDCGILPQSHGATSLEL